MLFIAPSAYLAFSCLSLAIIKFVKYSVGVVDGGSDAAVMDVAAGAVASCGVAGAVFLSRSLLLAFALWWLMLFVVLLLRSMLFVPLLMSVLGLTFVFLLVLIVGVIVIVVGVVDSVEIVTVVLSFYRFVLFIGAAGVALVVVAVVLVLALLGGFLISDDDVWHNSS